MLKISLVISLFITLSLQEVLAHGTDGGSEVSIENDTASGSHNHLPVRLESTGEIVFGFDSHSQEHDESESHAAESSFHIAPTVIIGREKIDRIISKDAAQDIVVGVGEVVPARKNQGYVHIVNSRLIYGAGLELSRQLNAGPFGAGIGLVYAKGQSSYSELHLKSLSEKGRELTLPGNFSDFSKWRDGEKLSYISSGSIIFHASVGIDQVVHAGVLASATGSWLLKLKKIDSTILNVSVSSVHAKSFGVEIENALVSLSTEKLKSAEKSLNFYLNMQSPEVNEALKLIYKGDLRAIQKLAENKELVNDLESIEGFTTASGKSVNLYLPFLFNVGASKYISNTYQASLDSADGTKGILYSGIVTKDETSRGVLSNYKKELNQFSTTFIKEDGPEEVKAFYAANFKWHYEKDDVKGVVVVEKMKQLADQTGFNSLRDLKIAPDNIGFFRIAMDISLTEADVLKALSALSGPLSFNEIKKKSMKNIDTYISTSDLELCHPSYTSEDCRRNLKKKTTAILEDLHDLSVEVSTNVRTLQHKAAVAGFSKLGAIMVKNQFILRELLKDMADAKISLAVEGEKVQKQTMSLN